jgi:hypothetical protein
VRRTFLLACLISCASTIGAFAQQRDVLVLELAERVTSKDIKAGDVIKLRVAEDLKQDGLVLVAKDTVVTGKVTLAGKAGFLGKEGEFMFELGSARTVLGEEVSLFGAFGRKSPAFSSKASRKDELIMLANPEVELAMLAAPILLPLSKGHQYVLEPGSRFLVEARVPLSDRSRLAVAQPERPLLGWGTVYFLAEQLASRYYSDSLNPKEARNMFDAGKIYCGSVRINHGNKSEVVILVPGHYECRVNGFEPFGFDVADGETYYLSVHTKSDWWGHAKAGTITALEAKDFANPWFAWWKKVESRDLRGTDGSLFHGPRQE